MPKNRKPIRRVSSSADLAFAIVVLASYLTTFSTIQSASLVEIMLLAVLGMVYIIIGTYGFNHCIRSENRIYDLVYFLIQIPLGAFIVLLTKGAGYNAMVLLPLAGHAVILLSSRWAYYVNAIIIVVYAITVRTYSGDFHSVLNNLPMFIAGLIFIVIFTQMAVDEEKAREEVEHLVEELEDLTIIRERNRLAREIHDGLGHYLTALLMQIQAAKAIMPKSPEKAMDLLDKAQQLSQEALLEVRQSVATLRPTPDQNRPLLELIEKMIADVGEGSIPVQLNVVGVPRVLSSAAHLTIFRAAQEGVNNARKHSQATQIWVELDYSDSEMVKVIIKDNGLGAESLDGGFGLTGLQERVRLLNGTYHISTEVGQGFILSVGVMG